MLLKPFMTKILQMRANFSASRLICDENENILHPDKDHYSTESARLPRQTTTSVMEASSKILDGEQKSSSNESEDDCVFQFHRINPSSP